MIPSLFIIVPTVMNLQVYAFIKNRCKKRSSDECLTSTESFFYALLLFMLLRHFDLLIYLMNICQVSTIFEAPCEALAI